MTRLGLPPLIQLALACAHLSACGGAQPSEAFVVRDSAGVRIVQTLWSDGTDLPTCSVATTPALDIGVVQGDPVCQLYRVFDALQLSDGRIAVVNQGSSEIRLYDAEGRYLGAVGREGEGPGEFRGVRAAWKDSDSLLAWDDELQRFPVFGPDGDFERSFRLVPRLYAGPSWWWTLELPWRNNAVGESCIPKGSYPFKRAMYYSGDGPGGRADYECFEVCDVPGRSLIHVHIANVIADLRGCIAPGEALGCVNNTWEVQRSGPAFRKFMAALAGIDQTRLEVRNEWQFGVGELSS